ncbi:MAG: tetratricopeptide (TPR) repeat protein [Saprospiraceae bacterium]
MDSIISGKRIEAGKYAVFSIPAQQQWEVIFYKGTDNWDVPEVLDSSKIAGRIMVSSSQLNDELEVFTISIGDFTNYAFNLHISWSNVSVSIPIELTTKEIMDKRIHNVLEGPNYNDYYSAAEYQMESGKEFRKGLKWIEKAIEVTDEVTWWDLCILAILLMELGEKEKALKVAKKGLIMAEKENRAYGINQFGKVLRRLEN